jgi:predicted MFS family arabinose efflux permease
MFIARLPMTTMGVLMTLHVVLDLDRGFGAAGLVGAVTMLGGAIGAPRVGRALDRYGLRPVVGVCGLAATAFWISAPHLPYSWLLVLSIPAGVLAVPAMSLARQFLTALVPPEERRAIFSLDTVLAEASFIVGPAAGVLVVTQLSAAVALTGMGVWLGVTAVALVMTNLPTRTAEEARNSSAVRRWLGPRLIGSYVVTVGALFTLIGTEVALIGTLRAHGETAYTGVVIAMMSVASIAGGLVHGALRHSRPQATLALLLAVLVVPVGLAGGVWWVLGIALIPMNLMCTPALAAGTEAVSRVAPASARGEAMGLFDAANRLGLGLGSPLVGLAVDRASPGWGFAAAGLGGVAIIGIGVLCGRWSSAGTGPVTTVDTGPAAPPIIQPVPSPVRTPSAPSDGAPVHR